MRRRIGLVGMRRIGGIGEEWRWVVRCKRDL